MSGARYVAWRLFRALLTIAGVLALVFLLVRLIPGDPVNAMLGEEALPQDRAALRAALCLDRSLVGQLECLADDVLDGSLGHSYRRRNRTVMSLIADVLPSSVALGLAAIAVALFVAIPLGTLAAAKRNTRLDSGASTLAVLGLAIPNIWLGPLLILAFAVELRWLPLPGDRESGLAGLILPAFTLGTALAAVLTRQTRAALIEVLGEQYIMAARARGLSSPRVLFKHGLRNALLPVLTVAGAQLGAILSGTVVTEKIFERSGIGALLLDACFARDFPVVQGTVLVVAIIYVGVNLLVDLLYTLVDPRVRLS